MLKLYFIMCTKQRLRIITRRGLYFDEAVNQCEFKYNEKIFIFGSVMSDDWWWLVECDTKINVYMRIYTKKTGTRCVNNPFNNYYHLQVNNNNNRNKWTERISNSPKNARAVASMHIMMFTRYKQKLIHLLFLLFRFQLCICYTDFFSFDLKHCSSGCWFYFCFWKFI